MEGNPDCTRGKIEAGLPLSQYQHKRKKKKTERSTVLKVRGILFEPMA